MPPHPKLALVYDRVNTPHGGAEQVLKALHTAFPDAPLYTSVYDADQARWAADFEVRPSWLQKLPGARQAHRWLAPLMPLAFESFDFSEFEVIVSVTSAEAKGIITHPHQLHICYLLTPTRYLYSHRSEYLESLPSFPGVKFLATLFLDYLTWWDQAAAARPDQVIPISELVGKRTHEFYHRSPEPVIYPPVAEPLTSESELKSSFNEVAAENDLKDNGYYLVVSRLVAYKRIDLAITACAELGRTLVIVGEGPAQQSLQKLSQSLPLSQQKKIIFLPHQSQSTVEALMIHARGLLMPGQEDFGITALEALSLGKPAVVYHQSGVAELIEDGETGIHLQELTTASLVSALQRLEATTFDSSHLLQSVRKYVTTSFVKKVKEQILTNWKQFQSDRKVRYE